MNHFSSFCKHTIYFVNCTNSLFTSFAVSGPATFAISFINFARSASLKMFTCLPLKYFAIFCASALLTFIWNWLAYFRSSSPVMVLILWLMTLSKIFTLSSLLPCKIWKLGGLCDSIKILFSEKEEQWLRKNIEKKVYFI